MGSMSVPGEIPTSLLFSSLPLLIGFAAAAARATEAIGPGQIDEVLVAGRLT
jgi:hypothetical protein